MYNEYNYRTDLTIIVKYTVLLYYHDCSHITCFYSYQPPCLRYLATSIKTTELYTIINNWIVQVWQCRRCRLFCYSHIHVHACTYLCCFALFVCLTLLASFFLPSHLSFKNMY